MAEIDISQMKVALSAIKDKARKRKANPTHYFTEMEDSFRKGIESRRKALERISNVITLDTPYLILVDKDLDGPTNLIEHHVEPMNNWAKVRGGIATNYDSFFKQDQLNFYFVWQNDTGGDAVVNVASSLMLNGEVEASSGATFFLSPQVPNGNMSLGVELSLFEWWNQPPTQPVRQPSQVRDVILLEARGTFVIFAITDDEKFGTVSDNFHVNYDVFAVPDQELAVFEVTLNLAYSGYHGGANADFSSENFLVLCPNVQLEVLSRPRPPRRPPITP